MDSKDNLRERVTALEQRMEYLHHQTRTVERRLRRWRGLACGVGLLALVSLPLPSGMATEEHPDKEHRRWPQRMQMLEVQVKILQKKLAAVTFDSTAKELVITGANLRIVNGLGKTDCGFGEEAIPNCPNGLGNLIVGYNEGSGRDDLSLENIRTGSHNVVVGANHNFSRFGGIVVGNFNEISGDFASVISGSSNTASGYGAAVSGGAGNQASGFLSAVSGGAINTASGSYSAVSGGNANQASGNGAAVSGGSVNMASGSGAAVSGGSDNTASGDEAAVSGGNRNRASGNGAAVSGGSDNTASGNGAAISGGERNTASGVSSSVSGGSNRSAPEEHNWAAGSLLEPN